MFEKIRSIISEQLSIDDVDTITLDTSLTLSEISFPIPSPGINTTSMIYTSPL